MLLKGETTAHSNFVYFLVWPFYFYFENFDIVLTAPGVPTSPLLFDQVFALADNVEIA